MGGKKSLIGPFLWRTQANTPHFTEVESEHRTEISVALVRGPKLSDFRVHHVWLSSPNIKEMQIAMKIWFFCL